MRRVAIIYSTMPRFIFRNDDERRIAVDFDADGDD